MQKSIIIVLAAMAMLFVACDCPRWHCHDCYDCYDCYDDYTPPPVPSGVYSITGNECVRVYWNPIYCCDLAGYAVWRGYSETGYYYLIAETPSAYYADWDVCNGETYYYAISAFDIWGNESDLSYDIVFDTPRPEGYNERVYLVEEYPDDAGYDFSYYSVVPYDYPTADIFFGYDEIAGSYYMQAANAYTDLLIFGPTGDLNDVNWAPEDGWLTGGSVEIHTGYSYLIWTADNHFAHVRMTYLGASYVRFDWAYQTDTGNPELRIRGDENPFKVSSDARDARQHSVNTRAVEAAQK